MSEPTPLRPGSSKRGIRAWFRRHHRALWWLHSVYALLLGMMVILFASKGFDHARVLTATLGGAFIVMVIVFRIFGQGQAQRERVEEGRHLKLSFFGMTYVLKNLYQGMLFFLLPFYWKSSSLDSVNAWFVCLLGLLALLSTVDLVFDNVLVRYRAVAAFFFAVTLFACANLVIPAFFSNVPTIWALMGSTVLSVFGFWLLHFPLRTLREKRSWFILGGVATAAVLAVYLGRAAIPPVPLYARHHGVGFGPLEDGRLAVEVTRLQRDRLEGLYATSDVTMPGGEGDRFRHVWRHRSAEAGTTRWKKDAPVQAKESAQKVRVRSALSLAELTEHSPIGEWVVDLVTTDDQIVSRTRFWVTE